MEKIGNLLQEQVSQMQEKAERQTGQEMICPKHDLEFEYVSGMYEEVCPACHVEEKEKKMFAMTVLDAKNSLALPERLKRCSFDNYLPVGAEAKKALKICKEFADSFEGSLIMVGGVGTGKTHLASAISLAAVETGRKTIFTTIPEIIREIRSTWGSNGKGELGEMVSEKDVVHKYADVPLLIIDEIGSQYGTDSEKIIISEIINGRYNNILPTVIIGNITIPEAKEYLGERVIDRLKHGGRIIVFDWESYRKLA